MEAIRFHFPSPQFEFFHPRGLTIWYPELQGVVGFDIKIYLNKPYLHDYTLYDMYLNTSTVSYGKFIVNDDDAFIRLGDNLRYEVNLQYSDGNKYRIRRWFTVKGGKMLFFYIFVEALNRIKNFLLIISRKSHFSLEGTTEKS